MKVYRKINDIEFQKETILTLGMFDGIHVGHCEIMRRMVASARESDARSVLVTFYPHPQAVIRNDAAIIDILTPLDEKIEILQETDLDATLVLPFTTALSATEPESFVEEILVKKVGIKEFVVGYNHALGRKRRGREDLFRTLGDRLGFLLEVIPPIEIAGHAVSSSRIRKLLLNGEVTVANTLLGREYRLNGVVKKGTQLGKEIGFPTANIDVTGDYKLVPGDGVYAVMTYVKGKSYPGMANIGTKPTVPGNNHGVEVHIHHFVGELYGESIQIEFVARLRDEKQFASIDALAAQINIDQKQSKEVLAKYIGGK